MTREEILEKSQKENKSKDIFDLEIQQSGFKAAYFSVFGFAAVISILQFAFERKVSAAVWAMPAGMLAVMFLVKFIKIRKKHELLVFIGYDILFLCLLAAFIFQLTGKI